MIKKFRQLGKESIIYGLGGVLTGAIRFFMLPIFTRIFPPTDYGTIDLLSTISGLVGAFVVLGMDSAQTYYFYESKTDNHKREVIRTTIGFNLLWGGFVFLICFSLIPIFNHLLFNGKLPTIYFVIVFGTIFFASFQSTFVNLFRLLFKPWQYLTTSLTNTVLGYGLAIYLVVYLHKHITGYLSGLLVSAVIVMLVSALLLRDWLPGRFSCPLLKKMLKYGIPLSPIGLAVRLINVSDRYFLLHYLDLKEVGIYAVGATFALTIALATQAFRLSWTPLSISMSKEPDANRFYQIVGQGYLVFGSIGVIILMGISLPLMTLLTVPEYYSGFKVVGLLSYGAVFYGFYTISGLGVWLGKKTIYMTVAIVASALVNLILNAMLIPVMGMIGAGLATCSAYIIGNLITLYFGERVYPIGFRLMPIVMIAGATLLVIFIQIYILGSTLYTPEKYCLIAALCVVSIFCLIYLGIGKQNLSGMVQLIKKV